MTKKKAFSQFTKKHLSPSEQNYDGFNKDRRENYFISVTKCLFCLLGRGEESHLQKEKTASISIRDTKEAPGPRQSSIMISSQHLHPHPAPAII